MAEMGSASPNIERREIDRVLRLKRSQRESKACYPCRQRKVKCDGRQPCRTCARRDHPQICVYNVEQGTIQKRASTQHRNREITDPPSQESSAPLPTPTRSVDDQTLHPSVSSPEHSRSLAQPNDDRSYVFSGDNSLVSMLGQQDPDGAMARQATSVLGLHNTYASYPFLEAKTPQGRWAALLDILPHRDEVLK